MARFFTVQMVHPDGDLWGRWLQPHLDFIQRLTDSGRIRASGRLTGLGKRAGFIVMNGESKEEIEGVIADDPFAQHGVIESLTILEWEPFLGVFAAETGGVPDLGGPSR